MAKLSCSVLILLPFKIYNVFKAIRIIRSNGFLPKRLTMLTILIKDNKKIKNKPLKIELCFLFR